ncbi:hypothetical protein I4U23_023159 [Adineta vaga]|nr:hypothetical protein I4U23_023159 [Adineta vaga]
MTKKFRCGRLLLTRDGRVKKLDLGNGGGTRTCDWTDDYMTFDDVHRQLLTVFSFINKKHQTSLYDFQHQPLDVKQFSTFTDYINKYGLNRNSTVVYLCTSEVDDDHNTPINIPIANNNHSLSIMKNEPEDNTPNTRSKSSSNEYSFIHVSNDMMKNIRELINQNPSNKALNKLFENLCLIHGYVFSIIIPLQQQSSESEAKLYLTNLNSIYGIFETTKSLLHENIDQFRYMKLFSMIRSSFFQFHNNIKIIRNRWMKTVECTSSSSSTMSDITPKNMNKNEKKLNESSLSTFAIPIDEKTKEKLKLFRPTFEVLRRLLAFTSKSKYFLEYSEFLIDSLEKMRVIRLNINLSDLSSIRDGERLLSAMRQRFSRRLNNQTFKQSKSDQRVYRWSIQVLGRLRGVKEKLMHDRKNLISRAARQDFSYD